MRYSRRSCACSGAGQRLPGVTLEFFGSVNSTIGPSILFVYQRNFQIVVFFDSQHADVTNRWREPGEFFRHALNDTNTSHSIDSFIAKIGAALGPVEAARRQ